MASGARAGHPSWSLAVAGGLLAVALVWFAVLPHDGMWDGLAIILALCAALRIADRGAVAGRARHLGVVRLRHAPRRRTSDPAPAFAIVLFSEIAAWASQRYRPRALVANLAAIGLPAPHRGDPAPGARGRRHHAPGVPGRRSRRAATCDLAVNFVLACSLLALMDGLSLAEASCAASRSSSPRSASRWRVTLAVAEVYERFGTGAQRPRPAPHRRVHVHGAARGHGARAHDAVRVAVMGRAVRPRAHARPTGWPGRAARRRGRRLRARHRDGGGHEPPLSRSRRTPRAPHDIGSFALPDRASRARRHAARGGLGAIRKHPELGADLLATSACTPGGRIVATHDSASMGAATTDGLGGDDIPPSPGSWRSWGGYDTLEPRRTRTAADDVFEALTELRRVAGRQLDAHYVEVLRSSSRAAAWTTADAGRADFHRRARDGGAELADSVARPRGSRGVAGTPSTAGPVPAAEAARNRRSASRPRRRLLQLRAAPAGWGSIGPAPGLGPPVCSCRGLDAFGKGRGDPSASSPSLDTRHVRRCRSFSAPTHDEKRHHFLWRFCRAARRRAAWPCSTARGTARCTGSASRAIGGHVYVLGSFTYCYPSCWPTGSPACATSWGICRPG